MKTISLKAISLPALCMACCWTLAMADPAGPYYVNQAHSPYPPGCLTLPLRQVDLYGDNVAWFWGGSMWLEVMHKVRSRDDYRNMGLVDVDMYRVGCAEPNRSVIMAEFSLPRTWVDPRNAQLVLPLAGGNTAMHYVPIEFKAEPNDWGQGIEQHALTKHAIGDFTGGWDDPRYFIWRFVLGVGPTGKFWPSEFLTEYYNGRFLLELFRNEPFGSIEIEVPATQELLEPNPSLPLNGRLTGTWVEQGAADQGFLLSFSNPVPPSGSAVESPEQAELLAFLSWYTYDPEGRQLWLVGNARFPQGATEVSLPLVQVVEGQFLGASLAAGSGVDARVVVGEVLLKARNCNTLDLDYDLTELGLGDGNLRLQRLFALETAGYPCRDYTARLSSLPANPNH